MWFIQLLEPQELLVCVCLIFTLSLINGAAANIHLLMSESCWELVNQSLQWRSLTWTSEIQEKLGLRTLLLQSVRRIQRFISINNRSFISLEIPTPIFISPPSFVNQLTSLNIIQAPVAPLRKSTWCAASARADENLQV